jgi:hypothetical protein
MAVFRSPAPRERNGEGKSRSRIERDLDYRSLLDKSVITGMTYRREIQLQSPVGYPESTMGQDQAPLKSGLAFNR